MSRKGYGLFTAQVTVTANTPDAMDVAVMHLSRRGRGYNNTVRQLDPRTAKVTVRHLAHNEHNGHHDIERRLSEHLARNGVDPSRVRVDWESTGSWDRRDCAVHNNCCHTTDHRAGRCGCAVVRSL